MTERTERLKVTDLAESTDLDEIIIGHELEQKYSGIFSERADVRFC